MPGPALIFHCAACDARREVVRVDADAPPTEAERTRREETLRGHLRHATCPACGARDPAMVAAHVRARRRGRLTLSAGFAALAVVAIAVPRIALVPPGLGAILWSLLLRARWRRRLWLPIVAEPVLWGGSIAWVLAAPRYAFMCPAVHALLALWPRPASDDPFVAAADALRFVESPYRG